MEKYTVENFFSHTSVFFFFAFFLRGGGGGAGWLADIFHVEILANNFILKLLVEMKWHYFIYRKIG